MLSLILTIFCSTSIALILKHNDTRKGDAITLLMGNYLVAAVIGLVILFITDNIKFSYQTFFFGLLLATFFVLSFFAFAKAVGAAGTALATVSSRLSVIVPIVLSIFIFHEVPNHFQVAGFVFTVVTILFFYLSLRNLSHGHLRMIDYFYLVAVLLGIGFNDFAMKIFKQWRGEIEEPFFLLTIFSFAYIYTAGYLVVKKTKVKKSTVLLGGLLGIPNIFSTFFLLGALAQLPAIVVYPVINIGIILLTSLGALIIWRERLNRFGILALIAGSIAIILLGM